MYQQNNKNTSRNLRVLLSTISIAVVLSSISFSRHYLFSNTLSLNKIPEKLEIIEYYPLFQNVDEYIVVGGKAVSDEVLIKASQGGVINYDGNKQTYKEGETICIIENEANGRLLTAEAEYKEKSRKLERLKEAKQKSPDAVASYTIEDAEFELDKAKGTFIALSNRMTGTIIKAPCDCTIQYPIILDKAHVHEGYDLFRIASLAKKVQGQLSVKLRNDHNIKIGDEVKVIDSKHRVHHTKIVMINTPTKDTTGSVFFETSPIELTGSEGINVVQILFAKEKQFKCVVRPEFVYQNRVLVMLKAEDSMEVPEIRLRMCKNLRDGRIVGDVYPGEMIVMPSSGTLNSEYIDKVYTTNPKNIVVVSKHEYEIDDIEEDNHPDKEQK